MSGLVELCPDACLDSIRDNNQWEQGMLRLMELGLPAGLAGLPLLAQADAGWFFQMIEKFGLLAAAVVFFLIRDFRREKEQNERIDKMISYQQGELQNALKAATEALTRNSEALQDVAEALRAKG